MNKQSEFDFVHLRRFSEAMTHGSYNGNPNNKRLALLGDAVIDLVVCEHLFGSTPELSAGKITEQRAAVVNASSLAKSAEALGLAQHLLTGQQLRDKKDTERMLSEALEALTGAIFVEHGYEQASQFIGQHIIPEAITTDTWNPKGKLQEITQNAGLGTPVYVTRETGEAVFEATIFLEGAALGRGKGTSKKEAEEAAAKFALLSIEDTIP